MSSHEFKTVDTDAQKLHWAETPAMMVLDKNGNLTFSGHAHWNLVKGEPLSRIDCQCMQYVQAENQHRSTGGFIKFQRDCVRVKCRPSPGGPNGVFRHDYFWFDVDLSTWQSLWNLCTQRVNGQANRCRAFIAQRVDFVVTSARDISSALTRLKLAKSATFGLARTATLAA